MPSNDYQIPEKYTKTNNGQVKKLRSPESTQKNHVRFRIAEVIPPDKSHRTACGTKFWRLRRQGKLGESKKKWSVSNLHTKSRSENFFSGFGHDGETARPRLEGAAPPLLVRGGTDQRRQGSLHQIAAFDTADSHDRVRHRRSTRVEAVRRERRCRRRRRARVSQALVKAAPERAGMIDRLGEIGRSRENLTVDADGDAPPRTVTRVGEAERWKKVVAVREEKLELDDANADEETDGDEA
ncbi:hypothetical protein TIFTF001_016591 [Ficus carica]|uniref:Uncharacterized protein n=1 Tax=Ficus carica TaxID=3494 RepID=A0AA88A0M8_FICCA|nr:hypothetical protein TIFTF001_016591 [Ficus carica]